MFKLNQVVKLELRNLLIWLGIFTAITAILDQTIPYWPWEGGLKVCSQQSLFLPGSGALQRAL